MNSNRKKAYSEVMEIINHLAKSEYEKIPKEVIERLEKNKDCEYKTNLKFDIPLDEQETLYETKVILSILHKNYLAKEIERKIIEEEEKQMVEKFKKK